jgi:hypothetical protein
MEKDLLRYVVLVEKYCGDKVVVERFTDFAPKHEAFLTCTRDDFPGMVFFYFIDTKRKRVKGYNKRAIEGLYT